MRDLLHIEFGEECTSREDLPTYVTLPDILLASLDRFYVSDFEFPILTGLRELENLIHAKDGFPNLRVIDIEGCWEEPSRPVDIYTPANPLARGSKEVGIEFNIRDYYIV